MRKMKNPFDFANLLSGGFATVFLCCIFPFLVPEARALPFAQNRVSLCSKGKTLEEVFKEISRKTGLFFVYNTSAVDVSLRIDAEISDAGIEAALDEVFKHTSYGYKLVENYILVSPGKRKPQERIFSGRVTDEDGNVLPGVTVRIKGVAEGVITDEKGEFSIKTNAAKEVVLVFSFIGKKTLEIKATEDYMHIRLQTLVENMADVVVTGYYEIEKRKLSSSVFTIKGSEVAEGAALGLDHMLQAKIPGLAVLGSSSTPGAATKIRIRGTSSISGNREPLWVVDGFIVEDPVPISTEELNNLDNVNLIGNAVSGINPEDIDRIDILKDASSTAIYGVKAANGVIVITTKKGRFGKPRISYNTYLTLSERPEYDGLNLMNSKERVDVSKEIEERGLVFGFRPANVGYEGLLDDLYTRKITYEEFLDKVRRIESVNTDWFDLLYHTAFSRKHNVTISGASSNINYYFSGSYNDIPATLRKTGIKQWTGLMKLGINMPYDIKIQLQSRVSFSDKDYLHPSVSPYQYAYKTSRAIPAFEENGEYSFYNKEVGRGDPLVYNILNERDHTGNKVNSDTYNFNLNLLWKPVEDLRLSIQAGLSYSNTAEKKWFSENSYRAARLRTYNANLIAPFAPWQTEVAELPYGGGLTTSSTKSKFYTLRFQTDYKKRSDTGHEFVVVGGVEARSTKYDGLRSTQFGYLPERGHTFIDISPITWPKYQKLLSAHPDEVTDMLTRFMSFYGSFTYAYVSRYIVNFNLRSDGSNKFGQDRRYRFLPVWSVSGRWNLHNEAFFRDILCVSTLSFRGSYGVQGNVSPEQTPRLITSVKGLDGVSVEYIQRLKYLPNHDLRWEKTYSFNVGTDFALFENRISGSLEYYRKKGRDQIVHYKVSPTSGVRSMALNAGNIENKGYELILNLIPVKSGMFTWALNINGARNVNRVVRSGIGTGYTYRDYISGRLIIDGKPVDSFYSYKFGGLNASGEPEFKDIEENEGETKEDMFKKVFTYSGRRIPLMTGGFGNTFTYGGITLSGLFSFSFGSKIRLNDLFDNVFQTLPQPQQNMSKTFVYRWRKPGDERFTDIPSLSDSPLDDVKSTGFGAKRVHEIAVNRWQMYNKSDIRVVSGNYIRLRNLSLSYKFPASLLGNTKIKTLSFKIEMKNLGLWASRRLKGQDPEQLALGGLSTPPTSSYTLGINVGF